MDLQKRKIEFVQEFLKIQNEEVVARLEKILRKEKDSSGGNNLERMSIEEFNSRINKSMDDSENGRLIKATDLKTRMKKWG